MKRRIFAWIAIIAIPTMYLLSIIFSILDLAFAPAFLWITILLTTIFPLSIFLVVKFPRDLADWYIRYKNFKNKTEEERRIQAKKNAKKKNNYYHKNYKKIKK